MSDVPTHQDLCCLRQHGSVTFPLARTAAPSYTTMDSSGHASPAERRNVPTNEALIRSGIDLGRSALNPRHVLSSPCVRPCLLVAPRTLNAVDGRITHTAPLHGVSYQIADPKTAPCRPGANDSTTSNVVCKSRRRARRNFGWLSHRQVQRATQRAV